MVGVPPDAAQLQADRIYLGWQYVLLHPDPGPPPKRPPREDVEEPDFDVDPEWIRRERLQEDLLNRPLRVLRAVMVGATALIYQGLFLAPHAVGQALKGSVFAAALFRELGFDTSPSPEAVRSDIIQAIRFHSGEDLIAFVQGIQQASAIDAHVVPEPWEMPGYEHPVIMAAGTFIQGGSLELSADAPIREPYIAYVQGGLTYAHAKIGILTAIDRMVQRGLLTNF